MRKQQFVSTTPSALRARRRLPGLVGVLLAAALLAGAAQAAAADPLPVQVVLVRHAEKAEGGGRDPALSAAGTARAAALAQALHGAGIVAIVTSEFARTRDTAAPLAAALGIAPQVVAAGDGIDAHVAAVAAAVRAASGPVLVVGHSNTVPALVAALGGRAVDALAEHQYDRMFLLTPSPAAPTLVEARYGAPTP